MSRKTPKSVVKAIEDHAGMVAYWVKKTENWNGEPVTDELRSGVLTGLNIMLESVLMAHNCYNGFRFIKYTENGVEWQDKPGHSLNNVEDQTREYFVKL